MGVWRRVSCGADGQEAGGVAYLDQELDGLGGLGDGLHVVGHNQRHLRHRVDLVAAGHHESGQSGRRQGGRDRVTEGTPPTPPSLSVSPGRLSGCGEPKRTALYPCRARDVKSELDWAPTANVQYNMFNPAHPAQSANGSVHHRERGVVHRCVGRDGADDAGVRRPSTRPGGAKNWLPVSDECPRPHTRRV